jgi:hypothetical protein
MKLQRPLTLDGVFLQNHICFGHPATLFFSRGSSGIEAKETLPILSSKPTQPIYRSVTVTLLVPRKSGAKISPA